MHRPIHLDVPEKENARSFIAPTIIRGLFALCIVGAVTLLLISESRLSSEKRQQTFETSGVYP
jgi:hypothetical protein